MPLALRKHVQNSPPTVQIAASLLKTGDTVAIIEFAISGFPYLEGRAVTEGATRRRRCCCVQSVGYQTIIGRVVHSALQPDPQNMLTILIDIWRAGIEADANFSDFFPEDI